MDCVTTLRRLKPENDVYLLRFRNSQGIDIPHNILLTSALKHFPEEIEMDIPSKVNAYDFKKLLSSTLSQTNLQPQVVSHYLKHSLSKSEYSLFMKRQFPCFSAVSVRYAIQIDQIPKIHYEFDFFYAAIELRLTSYLKD